MFVQFNDSVLERSLSMECMLSDVLWSQNNLQHHMVTLKYLKLKRLTATIQSV